MEEIWKDIKDYEKLYQISNLGRIRSKERTINHKTTYGGKYHVKSKILKPKIDKGYYRIGLLKNGIKKFYGVHRIVAEAFIENPNNYNIINHKDENPLNNNVDNLEWCTQKYNVNYGNANYKRIKKLSIKIKQYDLNGNYIKTWDSMNEAIRYYNNNTKICQCCKGKVNNACGFKWKYAN